MSASVNKSQIRSTAAEPRRGTLASERNMLSCCCRASANGLQWSSHVPHNVAPDHRALRIYISCACATSWSVYNPEAAATARIKCRRQQHPRFFPFRLLYSLCVVVVARDLRADVLRAFTNRVVLLLRSINIHNLGACVYMGDGQQVGTGGWNEGVYGEFLVRLLYNVKLDVDNGKRKL